MERTLVLIKPDAFQRALVGKLIGAIEQRGLKIVALKMLRMSPELAKEHYAHLVDKPFYPGLESYMTSHPIIAVVFEGPEAVEAVRQTVGATDPRKATPGTIRADYATDISRNLIHASDSKETAEQEVKRFFTEAELHNYSLLVSPYIVEDRE
ncbi:MAG: nucleoside-diphosphate kinase [Methanobacteriota archaeon]|nr:MAG: nucleoside-diphosphate kinase [Euryarchaeota archaeon]